MIKRLFDIMFSVFVLLLLLPFFVIIIILIKISSQGGIFFIQKRVGKNFREFNMYKFRTMKPDSEKSGLLTIGNNDVRITKVGNFLRKYKLDELPQFINVLKGDMSVVGPRPEVKKYVDLYNEKEKRILSIRPAITDNASVAFSNESEILAKYSNPEEAYIKEIMPQKLKIYLNYVEHRSFLSDLKILYTTFIKIFRF